MYNFRNTIILMLVVTLVVIGNVQPLRAQSDEEQIANDTETEDGEDSMDFSEPTAAAPASEATAAEPTDADWPPKNPDAEEPPLEEPASDEDSSEAAEAEASEFSEAEESASMEPAAESLPASGEATTDSDDQGKILSRSKNAAPNSKVQGIDGGTLAGTNGLQWPYFEQSTIGISGHAWIDTGYRKGESTKEGEPNEKQIIAQGRGVLRLSPTYVATNNWFIQGQLELVADKNQSKDVSQLVDTDDMWVKFGQWGKRRHNWDFQAGRYQAWRLFHLGLGLDLNTQERKGATIGSTVPPEFYGVSNLYYRPSSNLANLAFHYFPVDVLRFEVLLQTGFDSLNSIGTRAAMILDLGWMKFKTGAEYRQKTAVTEGAENLEQANGIGGTLQLVISQYVEVGGHYGITKQRVVKFDGGENFDASFTKWSAGGFLNATPFVKLGNLKYLTIGGGINYTSKWDTKEDEFENVGVFSHLQSFGAIQYRLFGKLLIKAVIAYAKADMSPTFADSTGIYQASTLSARLRLQYNF